MAKRMTKRARAHAERAAKVKAVQKVGYTKHAAVKFVESLKDYEKATGRPATAEELMSRADARKSGAVAQSRMRKTPQGSVYAEEMEERDRIVDSLRAKGILARQFEDMAAAAVEGRYKEALMLNKKAYEENIQMLNELIDEAKQDLPHVTGDEKYELNEAIAFLTRERDSLVEQAARYGTGSALNLKNTAVAKMLGKIM